MHKVNPTFKTHYQSKYAIRDTESYIQKILEGKNLYERQVLIVCVGTDKASGDCIGPYTGTLLRKAGFKNVIGDLFNTVNALNLSSVKDKIYEIYENPYIIALDACLGTSTSIGYITVEENPLKPGIGVNKILPELGDMHLTGIVDTGGYLENFALQCTPFSIVYAMSNIIASTLANILSEKRFEKSIYNDVTDKIFTSKELEKIVSF